MSPIVKVSIVVPCYNEAKYIARCLDSIIANDYPKEYLEVLIYDGGSTDGTLNVLSEYKKKYLFISVRHNAKKIQAAAMNLGIKDARGEIIIRMDAHVLYDKDYISQVVKLLNTTDAINVGGSLVVLGDNYLSKVIAIAVANPFVVGNAFYRLKQSKEKYVDTVCFGAWRKKDLLETGGFDESFVVNEDYELNYRLRAAGGKVLLSPKVGSRYFARSSFVKLIKQYFRYGFWKVKTVKKHPKSIVLRQLVAPVFVLALFFSALLFFLLEFPYLLMVILLSYVLTCLIFAFKALNLKIQYLPLFFILALSIHLSWGIGFWCGIIYWYLINKKEMKKS